MIAPTGTAPVPRLLVADARTFAREGVKALAARAGVEVVGEAADGNAAVALAAELAPDVVVAEMSLPGLNGARLAARLRGLLPDARVLVLSACEDVASVRAALDSGAAGYALKRSPAAELVRAIRAVASGGRYIDPALAGRVADSLTGPPALSSRETEVLRLVALGYSNKEIASRLEIDKRTVQTHKARSMEKLGLRSREELVRYAARRGWLGQD
jgi:DNA-binding NarL/FixJ family response regulator